MIERSTFVYFIKPINMDGPVKIGCSLVPLARLKSLMGWCPFELEILATAPGCYAEERRLFYRFRKHWLRSEWFRPAPDLMSFIKGVAETGRLPFPAYATTDAYPRERRLLGLPAILRRHGLSVDAFAAHAEVLPATVMSWMRHGAGRQGAGHAMAVLDEMGISYPPQALCDGPVPEIRPRRPYRHLPSAQEAAAE